MSPEIRFDISLHLVDWWEREGISLPVILLFLVSLSPPSHRDVQVEKTLQLTGQCAWRTRRMLFQSQLSVALARTTDGETESETTVQSETFASPSNETTSSPCSFRSLIAVISRQCREREDRAEQRARLLHPNGQIASLEETSVICRANLRHSALVDLHLSAKFSSPTAEVSNDFSRARSG